MDSYRVIVVVDGVRTVQAVVPLERPPRPGDSIGLPVAEAGATQSFVVRNVIARRRADLAGVVLAWTEGVARDAEPDETEPDDDGAG